MSANTRLNPKELQELDREIGVLTLLFATLIQLIKRGKRSNLQIAFLRKALQLFKENRLGLALPVVVQHDPKQILEFCPVTVETLPIKTHTKVWLRNTLEIVYLGELLARNWEENTHENQSAIDIRVLLGELGLPIEGVDLNELGWIPPYMRDVEVQKNLNRWKHQHIRDSNQSPMYDNMRKRCTGCKTLGQVLQKPRRPYEMFYEWNQFGTGILRRGMFIPKSWKPDSEHPDLVE